MPALPFPSHYRKYVMDCKEGHLVFKSLHATGCSRFSITLLPSAFVTLNLMLAVGPIEKVLAETP